jgi:hypothetical protein
VQRIDAPAWWMFPSRLGESHQVLAGEICQHARLLSVFRSFPGMAHPLNRMVHEPETTTGRKKERTMSSQSPISRTLLAVAAALAMSTIAVGAAVGPAQANANPVKVTLNA